MKLAIMPKEPTWWVWLVMLSAHAAGLAGHFAGFIADIALAPRRSHPRAMILKINRHISAGAALSRAGRQGAGADDKGFDPPLSWVRGERVETTP
ncbi:MAG: hypothetical protein HY299_02565 [Verrucomicrobia bacterium]|nr:hypothetical protein [Verrucomicrobiota bacterium]